MSAVSFALDLLDSELGHVLQTWILEGKDSFHLGRSPESDVVFASPYVSRAHAYVKQCPEGWELLPVSPGGVLVDGGRIERQLLQDGVIFRLTSRGPMLRFRAVAMAALVNGATLTLEGSQIPLLILDDEQLNREVNQIAEGNYFKELQRSKALFRARASARSTNGTT